MATTQAGDSEKVFFYQSFLIFFPSSFLSVLPFHLSPLQLLHNENVTVLFVSLSLSTLVVIFSLLRYSIDESVCLQFLSVSLFVFCPDRHTLVATDPSKSADSKYMHSVTRRSVPLKKANSH